jgi:hypothetical protein
MGNVKLIVFVPLWQMGLESGAEIGIMFFFKHTISGPIFFPGVITE